MVAVVVAGLATACGDSERDTLAIPGEDGTTTTGDGDGDGDATGDGPGTGDGDGDGDGDGPGPACAEMDIVFVIDDSVSMEEEQANLAANFPEFARVLDEYQVRNGDLLDYRVAVTTTGLDQYTVLGSVEVEDLGANGAFVDDRCGMVRPWVERDDANAADTFACAATVGIDGPLVEMPLRALDLAFADRVADGSNAGFRREDALLALVILTDEDDCSRLDNRFPAFEDVCEPGEPALVDTQEYIAAFDQFAGGRDRWAAAVIAGPGPDVCSSDFGVAEPANRLLRFVNEVGDNAVFSSICAGDLAGSLTDALNTFDAACKAFPMPQ